MKQDQQSYRRAANAALVGLATQVALAIVLILAALYTQSVAVHASYWYALGGLPIWFVLWVLFNQHRLERQEALEAEQLAAADARAAALFDEAGQQLQLARKRLEGIYKWGLGLVSVGLAVYLAAMGATLLWLNYGRIERLPNEPASYDALLTASMKLGVNMPLLLGVFCGAAFLAFLVARYVAGMTRVDTWQPLRGGASFLMGNAVAVAGLAIGGVVYLATSGNPIVFAVMALLIPGLMILLALETLLSFVFGIYRPRKTAEVVRPAFDSRILGWLTRPESLSKIVGETLNYQFGFEISRSWFFALLSKSMVPLVIAGIALVLLLSCVVIVAPHEKALVTFNGAVSRVVGPGPHLKAPWPLGKAQKFPVYRVQQLTVGSLASAKDADAILWTNTHGEGEEDYFVTAPTLTFLTSGDVGAGEVVAAELTGVELTVDYRIREDGLVQYATSAVRPDRLLHALALRRLNQYTVTHDILTLLDEGRRQANAILQRQIQEDADEMDLGIEVVYAGLTSVHPPQREEVAESFHQQIGALQEQQTTIERAQGDAITMLAGAAGSRERALAINDAINTYYRMQEDPQLADQMPQQVALIEQLLDDAGGEAALAILDARAERWERSLDEVASAAAFRTQLQAFQNSPTYFRARMMLDALETLENRRKTVVGVPGQTDPTLRFNLQDTGATGLGNILGNQ